MKVPSFCFTNLHAAKAAKTHPMCKNPVGLGANLLHTSLSLLGYFFSKSLIVSLISENIKSAKSFQSAIFFEIVKK